MQNTIDNFLIENGIRLYTNEYALSKKQSLDFINILEKADIFVLGCDVWAEDSKGFFSIGNSFYYQKTKYSIKDSLKKAKEYILNYKDDNMYFVFVLDTKKSF